jgi:hypothetical protein
MVSPDLIASLISLFLPAGGSSDCYGGFPERLPEKIQPSFFKDGLNKSAEIIGEKRENVQKYFNI